MDWGFSKKVDLIFMNSTDLNSYLPVERVLLIESYLLMLKTWNHTHNLVSKNHDDRKLLIEAIDSILGGRYLDNNHPVFDVGSGGGIPGVILSIIYPENSFTLVESNRKKCSFLRTVRSQLNLINMTVKNTRIENFTNIINIVSKAAFSPDHAGVLIDALAPGGCLSLWSTPMSQESFIKKLSKQGAYLLKSFSYRLPNHQERVILVFSKD